MPAGGRLWALDSLLWPFVHPAARLLRFIRSAGVHDMPRCRAVLLSVGVFPILDHYSEPLFDERQIPRPLSDERDLPGVDWNVAEQLQLLGSFTFNEELRDLSMAAVDELTFHMNNGFFESGDAEYWYGIIRLKKPRRIIEIGSGYSTLLARRAVEKNTWEDPDYQCQHICVEPSLGPWLERLGVTVIREKVERVGRSLFSELDENDILFIDSSHVIRPQGDVLFEYLELLPSLKKGVVVHVHDIFSPRDYLEDWVRRKVRLWNEQYLLEAFLTSNSDWKIIAALNLLHHHHFEKLKDKCPFLTPTREPGSFYIQKIG